LQGGGITPALPERITMKVKDLIEVLKTLNPEAQVLLGSDAELNEVYNKLEVSVYDSEEAVFKEGEEIELTEELVAKIKQVIIYGWRE
jgi:hypothetical protein